jgi:hypothetical protein
MLKYKLSSIVLGSMQDARKKANYARMYNDLRQMEIAFNLMYSDYNRWLDEDETGTASQYFVSIETILEEDIVTLGNYLSVAPVLPLIGWPNSYYGYQHDSHLGPYEPIGCETSSSNARSGPSLAIVNGLDDGSGGSYNYELFIKLNEMFDPSEDFDSDQTQAVRCGKIRTSGNDVLYALSDSE